jgi:hypothetical protein
VSTPELTETTIRYLYATTWLPTETNDTTVAVPGGSTKAIDTAGNLLHIALWNLRRMRAMEFEQLRPFEEERVRVLGGRSFSSFELRDPTLKMPGLEGALLRAAVRMSEEDEQGVRRLISLLDLDNRGPWNTVCGHCFTEAHAAGLVEMKGRLFKKVVFTDMAAVEALRERNDELRASRGEYLDAEPELTTAVIGDCLRTVIDGYSPRGGDSL